MLGSFALRARRVLTLPRFPMARKHKWNLGLQARLKYVCPRAPSTCSWLVFRAWVTLLSQAFGPEFVMQLYSLSRIRQCLKVTSCMQPSSIKKLRNARSWRPNRLGRRILARVRPSCLVYRISLQICSGGGTFFASPGAVLSAFSFEAPDCDLPDDC